MDHNKQNIEFPKFTRLDTNGVIEFMTIGDYDKCPDTLSTEEQTNNINQAEESLHLIENNISKQTEDTQEQLIAAVIPTPQPSVEQQAPQELKRNEKIRKGPRICIEDPRTQCLVRQAVQKRKINSGFSQELIDECTQLVIEKYRNKKHKTISTVTISDIRVDRYKVGSVPHMLKKKEEEERTRKETEKYNKEGKILKGTRVSAERKKRMTEYNNEIIISSKERIDEASHIATYKIIETLGPEYVAVFHAIKTYHENRFSERGPISRRQSAAFCSPLKKLLKGLVGTKSFEEAASEVLEAVKQRKYVEWTRLERKYSQQQKSQE